MYNAWFYRVDAMSCRGLVGPTTGLTRWRSTIAPAPVGSRPLFGLLLLDRRFKFCLASLKFIQALLQSHHFFLDSA
jgi:hypothetical protein